MNDIQLRKYGAEDVVLLCSSDFCECFRHQTLPRIFLSLFRSSIRFGQQHHLLAGEMNVSLLLIFSIATPNSVSLFLQYSQLQPSCSVEAKFFVIQSLSDPVSPTSTVSSYFHWLHLLFMMMCNRCVLPDLLWDNTETHPFDIAPRMVRHRSAIRCWAVTGCVCCAVVQCGEDWVSTLCTPSTPCHQNTELGVRDVPQTPLSGASGPYQFRVGAVAGLEHCLDAVAIVKTSCFR